MSKPMKSVSRTLKSAPRTSRLGEPAWDVATLFPRQGYWTDEDYLALDTNHLVELSDGVLEVLPMLSMSHQLIVAFLWETLKAFVNPRNLGALIFSAFPIRLKTGRFREPDV